MTASTSAGGWFANLRVGLKISMALAVALLAGTVVAALGLTGLSSTAASSTAIYEDNFQPAAALAVAQGAFDDELLNLAMLNIATGEADVATHRQAATASAGVVEAGVKSYQDLGVTGAQEESVTQLRQGLTAFGKVRDDLLIPATTSSDSNAYAAAYDRAAEILA